MCTCTRRVRRSPTTSTESPISLSGASKSDRGQVVAEDDEVDAVAVAAVHVLRGRDPGRRLLGDLDLRRLVAAQAGDDPGEDQDEAVGAGVDDPGLGEHVELPGVRCDGLLAGQRHRLEDLGEDLVLALLAHSRLEPPGVAVEAGQVRCGRAGHRADHGEHRALGRVADRVVGGVCGAGECRGDEDRVDQLAGPGGELLRRPAHDLAEDHAGVPARAHQRRSGDACTSSLRSASSPPPPRSGRARQAPPASSAPCCRPCRRRRPGRR